MKLITVIRFLFIAQITFGQNRVQKIDSFLNSFYNSGNFNGNVIIAEKGKVVKLIYENGTLYRITDDGEKFELKAISNSKFQMMRVEPDVFYQFIIKDNKVEKYIMTQPEMKVVRELTRVQ